MKKHTILVTAVGAIMGYGIVRSLREARNDLRIIGTDIFADAPGKQWCDSFFVAPPAADTAYPNFLLSLIRNCGAALVIPGIGEEVSRINTLRGEIEPIAKLALNSPRLIELSEDKWAQYEALAAAGLPTIKSIIKTPFDKAAALLGLPIVAKHRHKHGSQGIWIIDSRDDYNYWHQKFGDGFMAQPYVGDDAHEYTAAIFGYGDGSCSETICLRRRLGREGSTRKARVENIPQIETLCNRFATAFKPIGPTNLQFRLHDGNYLLLEVNPRFSSATSIRAAFGFNEAAMAIEYYLEGRRPAAATIRRGRAARYFEDIIEYET